MPELTKHRSRRPASGPARAWIDDTPVDAEEARSLLLRLLSGGPVLLAVSGGPDLVALMRLCAQLEPEPGVAIRVATVEHGLRVDSGSEATQVATWARECGFEHEILHWRSAKPATGLQERARAARYELLADHARALGTMTLVTAHTLDDQAETVLMRLARGSGLDGLAGMRHSSCRAGLTLARPLLGIAKARLVATCRAHGWPFFMDPSNADPRFARSRWRALLPALGAEGVTPNRLARLATRIARAQDALEFKAAQAFEAACLMRQAGRLVLDLDGLMMREPDEIVLRVLMRAIIVMGRHGLRPPRLERLEAASAALGEAARSRKILRRTLGGIILATDRAGRLTLVSEGSRSRGMRQAGAAVRRDAGSAAQGGNSDARLPLV